MLTIALDGALPGAYFSFRIAHAPRGAFDRDTDSVHFERRCVRYHKTRKGGQHEISNQHEAVRRWGQLAVFAVGGCAIEEAFQPTPIGATWTYAQHNTGSFAAQLGASDVQQHRVEAGRVRKRHCRALRD